MDPAKVAQMVEVLNGLTARDALCLLVGCMLTVLDEAPSDEERQRSLDGGIDLLRRVLVGSTHEHLSVRENLAQITRRLIHGATHCGRVRNRVEQHEVGVRTWKPPTAMLRSSESADLRRKSRCGRGF